MIIPWHTDVIATLANGSTCKWSATELTGQMDTTSIGPIKLAAMCPHKRSVLLLTSDHRFLLGSNVRRGPNTYFRKGPEDITALVCEVLEIEEADVEKLVVEIKISKDSLAIRTENKVGTIWLTNDGSERDYYLEAYSFTERIDLFDYDYGKGYVRTDDNKMHLVGVDMGYEKGIPAEICFSNTASIREIVCGNVYTLLLMYDGSVYARGFDYSPSEPFTPVMFPSNEFITRIVTNGTKIIYITLEGLCYYTDVESKPHPGEALNQCTSPVLLQSLEGRFVTNAFIVDWEIVIQDDSNRLCLLQFDRPKPRWPDKPRYIIDLHVINGSIQPVDLPYFDDKDIVSVIQASRSIYLTSATGRVYQSNRIKDWDTNEVKFFNDNPVAVIADGRATMIPSALSVLDRDV